MTTPPPSNSAESLLIAALDHAPEGREAFLITACGEDAALLTEVRALLAAHEAMPTGFLTESAVNGLTDSDLDATIKAAPGTLPPIRAAEREGELIGRYKLLQQIGEGGFGTVWMAEQMEPVSRRVALKIIKLGMDTREVIARFEQERQALAMMDHPNIAKVLDAGATDKGRPFFVMELVKGMPITQYCDEAQLGTRERLALFGDVCSAIQHAHQKGVIHRDIKPSNVMVTLHGDKPVVKVIDFGIAKATQGKLTDKTLFTRFEQFIGTPVYMSPEQASLSGLDIDTRSDIYALGILLYELLVGKPPFDGKSLLSAGYEEMRRIIREVEPPKPSSRLSTVTAEERSTLAKARQIAPEKLGRLVEPDLDWIVMKAIEKDRTRRYETASDLAQDIVRFLADEPVSATPPSAGYRFGKWVRRNKRLFAAGTAIAASLIIGLSVSTWLFFKERIAHSRAVTAEIQTQVALAESNLQRGKAESERDRANDKEKLIQRRLYIADVNLAQRAWDDGNADRVLELLSMHRPQPGGPDSRGFEWFYLEHLCRSALLSFKVERLHGVVEGLRFSPDGKRVALLDFNGDVTLWDPVGGKNLLQLGWVIVPKDKNGIVEDMSGLVAFSPDGKRVAMPNGKDHSVKVHDATSGKEVFKLTGHTDGIMSVVFSPDGRRLASASADTTVKVWDATSGAEMLTFKGHSGRVGKVVFSPDGTRLASASDDNTVKIWDATTGVEALTLSADAGLVVCMAFSADGKRLVSVCGRPGIKTEKVWDATNGQTLTQKDLDYSPMHVAISPDGDRIAWSGPSGPVEVWETGENSRKIGIKGYRGVVGSLVFTPDGKGLATASQGSDHRVTVWDVTRTQEALTLDALSGGYAVSPDCKRVAADGTPSMVKVWDATSGQETLHLPAHAESHISMAFSEAGNWLAAGGVDGTVQTWDTASGREALLLKAHTGMALRVAFSPDGTRLVSAGEDKVVKVWDVPSGKEIFNLPGITGEIRGLVFSPDGKWLAAESYDKMSKLKTGKVWDATNGRETPNLAGIKGHGLSKMVFSPDGKRLAAQFTDGQKYPAGLTKPTSVKVWDTADGHNPLSLGESTDTFACIAFSPDGKRVTGAFFAQPIIKMWDAASGEEMLTLKEQNQRGQITSVVFSPDGKRLLSLGGEAVRPKDVKIWDAATAEEILTLQGSEARAMGKSLVLSPDGKRLASLGTTVIKMWDATAGPESNGSAPGRTSADFWKEYDEAKTQGARSAANRAAQQARREAGQGKKLNSAAVPPNTVGGTKAGNEGQDGRPTSEQRERFAKLSREGKENFLHAMKESLETLRKATVEEHTAFIENLLNKIEAEDQAKKSKTP